MSNSLPRQSAEFRDTPDYRQSGEHLNFVQVAEEVDGGTFWSPDFAYGADSRNLQDLERACDGWRFSEDSDQLALTNNRLPHWRIGRDLEKVDPSNPELPDDEQGVAVVTDGDESRPEVIYYFDNLGRIVGYRTTAHRNPNALGKDKRMHPADYNHRSWALNDDNQVEQELRVVKWADGPLETIEDWEPVRWAQEHPGLIHKA